jgi:hypothetical protein
MLSPVGPTTSSFFFVSRIGRMPSFFIRVMDLRAASREYRLFSVLSIGVVAPFSIFNV